MIGPDGARALRRLAGAGAVRAAGPADSVAGRVPAYVVRPPAVDALAAVLAAANDRDWAVVPRGAGTRMDWGAPPARCDVVLETRALRRVLAHVPGDHVAVVEAGVRAPELDERLRAGGGPPQRLMLDPRGAQRSTLGGAAAAAAAGPGRHRYGTWRDVLLGARFVLADGTVARAGGTVVKNVAGYDLGRLLLGSRGTLAVLVELAVKLHPLPEARATVVVEGVEPGDLVSLGAGLRRSAADVTAAELLWPEGQLVLRVEGSPAVASAEAADLARETGGRLAPPPVADQLWSRVSRRPWDGPGAIVQVAVPLAEVGQLARAVAGLRGRAALGLGLGTGGVRLEAAAEPLAELRTTVERLGGSCRALRVPPELAVAAESRPSPAALRLAAELRAAYDPRSTLSPGRLGWGLP